MRLLTLRLLVCFVTLGCEGVDVAGTSAMLNVDVEDINVRTWIDEDDCDANGVCNLTGAINRALDECNASPPNSTFAGCRIRIPAGEYVLDDTVVLCRQHHVFGDGGRGWGARTLIRVAPGVTAFRVATSDECLNPATTPRRNPDGSALASGDEPPGGNWSEISDLGIVSAGCVSGCDADPFYGVQMHVRAALRRMWIRGFAQGVRISADVRTHRPTCDTVEPGVDCRGNANLWLIEDVVVDGNQHAGVYVAGGDSNAGLGTMVSAVGNCEGAAEFEELGECANIVDQSFLGSTWIATHTAANNATAGLYPGYISSGDSQASAFVGPYSESNQKPSVLSTHSTSISGLSEWEPNVLGLRIGGRDVHGHLRVHNLSDVNNQVYVEMGTGTVGSFFGLHSVSMNSSKPLRLKMSLVPAPNAPAACSGPQNPFDTCEAHDDMVNGVRCDQCIDGWYTFDVANLNASRTMRIHASGLGGLPAGHLALREPFTVGVAANYAGPVVCPSHPDNVCAP